MKEAPTKGAKKLITRVLLFDYEPFLSTNHCCSGGHRRATLCCCLLLLASSPIRMRMH